MERVASVRAPELREGRSSARDGASLRVGASPRAGASAPEATRRLAAALLAGSPRVMAAEPGLVRADARGWGRRGGEEALGRTLRDAAEQAGFGTVRRVGSDTVRRTGSGGSGSGTGVGVGVADTPVAADAAAALAAAEDGGGAGPGRPADGPVGDPPSVRSPAPGVRIVPPGGDRAFLAPLSPDLLPLSEGMRETLRSLDVRRIGWLAERGPAELEARFGPAGLRAARWARGEDDRLFRPLAPGDPPEVRMELEGPARATEPLLFVLRHLLARLCGDLAGEGRHAARLRLGLELEEGGERAVKVAPARPTLREGLLLELCRAGLEREADGGRLPGAVTAVSLTAVERAPAPVRQEDLFAGERRDPATAAGVLSRLRARLGEGSVVRPRTRPGHRPEARSGWEPAELEAGGAGGSGSARCAGGSGSTPRARGSPPGAPSGDPPRSVAPPASVLRLLPEPREVEVRCEHGRPAALLEEDTLREIVAAEGPERLSGEGWGRPYRREYFRVCTAEGELLWLFRTWRRRPARGSAGGAEVGSGASAEVWRLHGWWD